MVNLRFSSESASEKSHIFGRFGAAVIGKWKESSVEVPALQHAVLGKVGQHVQFDWCTRPFVGTLYKSLYCSSVKDRLHWLLPACKTVQFRAFAFFLPADVDLLHLLLIQQELQCVLVLRTNCHRSVSAVPKVFVYLHPFRASLPKFPNSPTSHPLFFTPNFDTSPLFYTYPLLSLIFFFIMFKLGGSRVLASATRSSKVRDKLLGPLSRCISAAPNSFPKSPQHKLTVSFLHRSSSLPIPLSVESPVLLNNRGISVFTSIALPSSCAR